MSSFYPQVKEAIQQEIYKKVAEKRVYFDTGKTFSTKLQKVDREVNTEGSIYIL